MTGLRKGYFRTVNGKPVFVRPGFSARRIKSVIKKDNIMKQVTPVVLQDELATSPEFEEVAKLDAAYVAFRKLVRSLLQQEEAGQASNIIESAIADGWEQFTADALKLFDLSIDDIDSEETVENKTQMSAADNELRAEFAAMKQEQAMTKRIYQLERRADKLLAERVITPAERKSLFANLSVEDDVVAVFSKFSESQGLSLADYLSRLEFCLDWREKNGSSGAALFFTQIADDKIGSYDAQAEEASAFVQEYRSRNGYE
ncbi:hypothetical protein [Brasilonema sp. UFV-L1]|uniref:hypothetical protein n=2 Tax=Brasilonema sp. UFV-L1 TaxID=2234130 RepID=UPI00145DE0BB|nr:hypothetical protein [Brasilonema sp. UFV-L1]NMG10712.1 hypothetical protein [Brasilonema sp. UFV-L1]